MDLNTLDEGKQLHIQTSAPRPYWVNKTKHTTCTFPNYEKVTMVIDSFFFFFYFLFFLYIYINFFVHRRKLILTCNERCHLAGYADDSGHQDNVTLL